MFSATLLRSSRQIVNSSRHSFATLSPKTIEVVKSTAPVLREHGYTITRCFYKNMFAKNPHLKEIFNQTHQVELKGDHAKQPWALACSVLGYAENIDNLAALGPAIEKIAHRHVNLNVRADGYPIVGENLMGAIGETLGDAATPEIVAAWQEAYGFLAEVLINRETELRESLRDAPGGWEGWRDFVVESKVAECYGMMSFVLKPKDGGEVIRHIPGQYVSLQMDIPGSGVIARNYTISSAPNGKNIRITVKRDTPLTHDSPPGLASYFLHDYVEVGDSLSVGIPCGTFVLGEEDQKTKKPLVFLSGGVGITPVVAMFSSIMEKHPDHKIVWLNAVKNAMVDPMHDYLTKLANRRLNVNLKFLYDSPPNDEWPRGPLTIDHIKSAVYEKDSLYYICGPPGMMSSLRNGLNQWGVPESSIITDGR